MAKQTIINNGWKERHKPAEGDDKVKYPIIATIVTIVKQHQYMNKQQLAAKIWA